MGEKIESLNAESTNKASKRLVAVNFQGLLPCYIANRIHSILADVKENTVGEIEYRDEIYTTQTKRGNKKCTKQKL